MNEYDGLEYEVVEFSSEDVIVNSSCPAYRDAEVPDI